MQSIEGLDSGFPEINFCTWLCKKPQDLKPNDPSISSSWSNSDDIIVTLVSLVFSSDAVMLQFHGVPFGMARPLGTSPPPATAPGAASVFHTGAT